MKRFTYHENVGSKVAVFMRYCRKIFQLEKEKLLCRDEDRKIRTRDKIVSIKDTFKKKDFPHFFSENPSGKVAVYTAVFGDYDKIKPIGTRSPRCDYYLITDQKVDPELGWTIKEVTFPKSIACESQAIKNRYCKMHPHILFPEYEYSLYLDGVMEPKYDLFPLLGRMGERFLGMYRHYTRDCIYDEAQTVVRIGKADKEAVDKLMAEYRSQGFPEHFGLTAGGIILRKHHSDECKKIMNEWWNMYLNGPKRDQLSLMYCMWENGYSLSDIADLGIDYMIDPRLVSEGHNR